MTTQRHALVTRLAILVLIAFSAASTLSQAGPTIPLEGLDPVMLSQGKEVQGDMKYSVTRGQFQYIFANPENKAAFEKDPTRYEIQLEGYCARMGAPTTGNPDLFAVHQGRIYIFGSAECQKLFKSTPEKYLETPAAPKSPPTAEAIKRGQALISKAVEALGGNKLDQLVSFQRKTVRPDGIKNSLLMSFPDSIRQETIRPNFTLVNVVTPTEAFFVVNNRGQGMPEDNRNFVYRELNHELVVLLRARTKPEFKASATGNDKIGETAVELVEVELKGFTTTLGFDPATGRVLSQKYHGRGPGGAVGDIVLTYSDYRSIEGVSLPFKVDATFDGQPYPALSATSETMTINAPVDPANFRKPTPVSN